MTDTICALATPTGGAIAIVRLSGPQAISIVGKIFRSPSGRKLSEAKANTLHYGTIYSSGKPVDDVVVSVYRAPHSYTGEECVEISCHGSRYIVREILLLLQAGGARQAEPGEYTRRAYLNGKMDLSQAEAVADIIAATNRASHDLAMSQLRGHVRTALEDMRDRLQKLTALLELELDFSDHEDLEFADRTELLTLARDIEQRLTHLADTYRTGKAIKDGIPVAIVGAPNVGKSTLLNRLLGEDRAIVSDIPGTTRDAIEDTIDIDGITFRFIDTAGLRNTADKVEKIGIARARQAIARASIILYLYDTHPSDIDVGDEGLCTLPHCGSHGVTPSLGGKPVLLVHNKSDISSTPIFPDEIPISAKRGSNIDLLKNRILAAADIPDIQESDVIITSARQYGLLEEALSGLRHVIDGLGGTPGSAPLSTDLVAEDLRLVLDRIGEVTGVERVTPESTLSLIFSSFCIGK